MSIEVHLFSNCFTTNLHQYFLKLLFAFFVRIRAYIQHDKESKDPRGRTPLHLSVTLRRLRCAQELLNHGADVLALNRHQYSGESSRHFLNLCAVALSLITSAQRMACARMSVFSVLANGGAKIHCTVAMLVSYSH